MTGSKRDAIVEAALLHLYIQAESKRAFYARMKRRILRLVANQFWDTHTFGKAVKRSGSAKYVQVSKKVPPSCYYCTSHPLVEPEREAAVFLTSSKAIASDTCQTVAPSWPRPSTARPTANKGSPSKHWTTQTDPALTSVPGACSDECSPRTAAGSSP